MTATDSSYCQMLALDLGAGSGRAVLGTLDHGILTLRELHRFPNHPVELAGHLYWNYVGLFEEIKEALRKCGASGINPASLGVDTWGVDFGFLACDGSVAGQPFSYRDRRTSGAMEEFFKRIPRERVYGLTGIQFMQFNTLFQLYAMKRDESPVLSIAHQLLFMPDLFTYLLCGSRTTEYSVASTSQMLNPATRQWDATLLKALGIPETMMPTIIAPGTIVGHLHEFLRNETGLREVPVVATASHDTAAAVAAVPAEGNAWAYISSGTWSLMGVELDHPIMSPQALTYNFTNEGGVGNTIRFLKNIAGLWLLQECKRIWDREHSISFDDLVKMAETAPAFRTVIDPDAPEFLSPDDMPEAIRGFARRTNQVVPETPAQITRCILEGLALKYRSVLQQLRVLSPRPIDTIHIIGGGVQNRLLCQFAADATGLPVVAGPVEATAVGNVLVQALALGVLDSLSTARRIVQRSFKVERYVPSPGNEWTRAADRLDQLLH